jgi:hypothetical protein
MANNVGNKLTIKCQDSDIMNRIRKLILRTDKNKNQEFTMEILTPRSMAFADEEHYDLYWNRVFWDTKRDAYDYTIIDSGNTIILLYNTAWSPNCKWIEALCSYLDEYLLYSRDKDKCDLEIEHRYSEYAMNFGGFVLWRPGLKFEYKHYDSFMEYLKNHNPESYQRMLETEEEMKSGHHLVMRISLPI